MIHDASLRASELLGERLMKLLSVDAARTTHLAWSLAPAYRRIQRPLLKIGVEKCTFIDPCQAVYGADSKNLIDGLGSTAGGIKSRSRSSDGYVVIPKKLLGIS